MTKKISEPKIEIPEDIKEKLKELKAKLDKFKDKILKDYNKEIIGISLLPPEKNPEKKEKPQNDIDVLVLVNDNDVEKKFELREKIIKDSNKHAEEIDKNLKPLVMLVSELKEVCFDQKYDLLQAIAMSAPIHDPTDILAALKIAEVHKSMVLKKFEKYIVSYVAAGSLFRGEKSHDIDVYVVVDDTDVKKMSRFELREKLRAIIVTLGFDAESITGVKKLFHVQVYILTDFWESVKDAHPVIFTFLRDGVPLYDRGVFMPWKLLLQMGRIRPSAEAIDMQMDIGEKLLDRAKKKLLGIAAEDVYYAILNPSQAALMLYGVNPPTPKETIQLFDEIFVKKEKLLEPKYVKILTDTSKLFKDIEHAKVKEITGTELDGYIKDGEEYLKRIKRLFDQIDKRHEKESLTQTYSTCIKISKDVLKEANIETNDQNLEKDLKAYVDKSNLPEKVVGFIKELKKAKKEQKEKKLTKAEAEKINREARTFIRIMVEHLQRKKSFELDKAKIRFRYGDKYGEILLLDKMAFIIPDIEAKEKEVQKSVINEDGSLGSVEKSSSQELEEYLTKTNIPSKIFIKEKMFEDLKKIFGKNIEVMVNF